MHPTSQRHHVPSVVTAITLMWLGWTAAVAASIVCAIYLPSDPSRTNTFAYRYSMVFPVGIFLFPIVLGSGLRYWTSRVRHFLLKLIPYFCGLLVVFQTLFFGVFLVPEFLRVFLVLNAVLYVVYLPAFIKLPRTEGPPPLPGGPA